MDVPLYPGKEQMKSLVFGYPNTRSGVSGYISTTFLQSKQDDSDGSSFVIEKDVNANISIAINGLRKNMAFLTVLQRTNYMLITSFCTQKETNFACQ